MPRRIQEDGEKSKIHNAHYGSSLSLDSIGNDVAETRLSLEVLVERTDSEKDQRFCG